MKSKIECSLSTGASPEDGVPDMIVISEIDENGIAVNLRARYTKDVIYVSFLKIRLIADIVSWTHSFVCKLIKLFDNLVHEIKCLIHMSAIY